MFISELIFSGIVHFMAFSLNGNVFEKQLHVYRALALVHMQLLEVSLPLALQTVLRFLPLIFKY